MPKAAAARWAALGDAAPTRRAAQGELRQGVQDLQHHAVELQPGWKAPKPKGKEAEAGGTFIHT